MAATRIDCDIHPAVGGTRTTLLPYLDDHWKEQVVSRAIVEGIRSGSEQAAGANPDAVAAVEALARFVETSGQTLNIKLTPTGRVPMMPLVQLLKTAPQAALAQFRIEASTGL